MRNCRISEIIQNTVSYRRAVLLRLRQLSDIGTDAPGFKDAGGHFRIGDFHVVAL